ncbi:MAG: Uma2 family endonuclease [Spirochaetota bacterium]|nr:Uma2 family endonuclease [Spirochaetota bacterium]
METSPQKLNREFTYKDYLSWTNDKERWELIDGVAYDMSPAPTRNHQNILGKLFRLISDITDKGKCETYVAPFDIRLSEVPELDSSPEDEDVSTVVQPDISVFCNPELLDGRGAHGSPDLVIEILSPSTGYKDQTTKLALYERFHVKEYWLVNGDVPSVMVYRLGLDGVFGKPDYYRIDEKVHSKVLGGVDISLSLFVSKK